MSRQKNNYTKKNRFLSILIWETFCIVELSPTPCYKFECACQFIQLNFTAIGNQNINLFVFYIWSGSTKLNEVLTPKQFLFSWANNMPVTNSEWSHTTDIVRNVGKSHTLGCITFVLKKLEIFHWYFIYHCWWCVSRGWSEDLQAIEILRGIIVTVNGAYDEGFSVEFGISSCEHPWKRGKAAFWNIREIK